jgi:hypothetical protein
MAKLYRRSWEKWGFGRAGAISNPLSSRSGTDGAVSGASQASPVAIFQSATGSFASTDVGRKIRLIGTPNNRYDGLYVIDSINSSTSINLRWNHNVTGTPNSPARFMENGTSIQWRIMASCTFTADAANDIQGWHPGSYVNIEGASNTGNKGMWLISHVLTNQTCILSKGFVFWVAEGGPGNYQTFTGSDQLAAVDFVAESSLQWIITDIEPYNGVHSYMLMRQQMIDSGWQVWQTRGGTLYTSTTYIDDTVFRSVGETDAALPNGKVLYFRSVCIGRSRSGVGLYGEVTISGSPYLHWDVTQSAGGVPGSGIAPLKATTAQVIASVPTQSNITVTNQGDFIIDQIASLDILSAGRNGTVFQVVRRDHVMISDADEFLWYQNQTGTAGAAQLWGFSSLKPIGQNQNVVAITAATSGSGPYTVSTGTANLASLGYQVGDQICIRGLSTSPAEYIETTTITGFDASNPLDNKVFVSSLSQVYGQGSDSVKGFIGEDPFMAGSILGTATVAVRLHNSARFGNATGHDYDSANGGLSAINSAGLSSFAELIPNKRSGRWGIAALQIRNTATFEFRGRMRYLFVTDTTKLPHGKKLMNPVDGTVYVVVQVGLFTSQSGLFGPIPKLQAGIK